MHWVKKKNFDKLKAGDALMSGSGMTADLKNFVAQRAWRKRWRGVLEAAAIRLSRRTTFGTRLPLRNQVVLGQKWDSAA